MRKQYAFLLSFLLVVGLGSVCSSCGSSTSGDGANGANLDGTSTTIQRTTTTLAPASWEVVTPPETVPAARFGGSLTYATAESKLILFGGWDGGSDYLDDLWSYDPSTGNWEWLETADTAPGPRASHAVAYDPVASRLVLFGGFDGSTYYDDTWVYDLAQNTWSSRAFVTSTPPARYGHSMAYDPVTKQIILFGGFDGIREYDDTWAYDLTTNVWTNLRPEGHSPEARDSHSMVYDPGEETMVLFGGWNTTSTFADTWTYDPVDNTWTLRKPSGAAPASRALHQMVYDPSIRKIVIFGGGTSSATYNDSWLLDLAEDTWAPAVASGGPPAARAGHAMAYDSANSQILAFGGSNGIGDYFNDMWRLTR